MQNPAFILDKKIFFHIQRQGFKMHDHYHFGIFMSIDTSKKKFPNKCLTIVFNHVIKLF